MRDLLNAIFTINLRYTDSMSQILRAATEKMLQKILNDLNWKTEAYLLWSDDKEMAEGLEELYGDVDALEFYPGVLLEKARANSIFGESMVEMGAPFSLKGLMGNPICSPEYWKPSTFGGETGFNIVKTSTLKKLVCLNTKWCPYVAFRVPPNQEEAGGRKASTELWGDATSDNVLLEEIKDKHKVFDQKCLQTLKFYFKRLHVCTLLFR